jgi:16S rRNA (cytidine1402-2'-O)-methyltransferase
LGDITARALDVLRSVEVVAAEDTRDTSRLLGHFAISAKLVPLHEHNEREAAARLVALLQSGKSVALVCDAGTPGISDPGALFVRMAREAGIRVSPIPGANAAISALSAAGIAAPHFLFYGFLPHQPAARRKALQALRDLPYTLVFYESPHRILETVADLEAVLGSARRITFARELTKVFETIHTCDLGGALAWLRQDPHRQKGEFVLLVTGAEPVQGEAISEDARRMLKVLLESLPLKQAVKLAAEITGEKKNALYELALAWKGEN